MELKEQELNFQQIADASPIALVITNNRGKIVYTNAALISLFGYQEKELEGRELDFLLEDIHQIYPQGFWFDESNHLSAVGQGNAKEFLAQDKSGTKFPVEVQMMPVKTNERFYMVLSISSISERVKAIEQLSLIIESALNAMILTDSSGRIVVANKQTELLFGYERSELTGKKIEVLVPQRMRKDHPGHRKGFYEHPKARPMGAGRDLYAVKKDGTEIPVEIGLNPVEKDGEKYVLASVIDITERKKNEEAIQQYARQIEEKNKELEEFAHVASHDLREPLNSIISLTEILLLRKSGQLDEETVKLLGFIDRSALRMTELIKGLLEYAQLGNSKDLVLTDLNELLETVLLDLDASVKASGAIITHEELPVVKVYAMEFRLLLQNLISNALKYRKPDVPPRITITSKQAGSGWEFAVTDNGIGIPENKSDLVFKLFHRLHGKNEYEGTGIGLAHCRKIVELHEGKIWVKSKVGEGSTFYFFIPAKINRQKAHQ